MAGTTQHSTARHPSDKRPPCAVTACDGLGSVTINGFHWCGTCALSLDRVLTAARAMAPRPQAVPA